MVKAPLDRTFDVFSDITQMADRISGIKSAKILSEEQKGTGVEWEETREIFGQEATQRMGITELKTNEFYVVESEHSNVKYHTRFNFETVGDSTKVDMVFDANPRTFSARMGLFIGNLMGGMMRKLMVKDMEDLKAFAEQGS